MKKRKWKMPESSKLPKNWINKKISIGPDGITMKDKTDIEKKAEFQQASGGLALKGALRIENRMREAAGEPKLTMDEYLITLAGEA